MKVAGAMNAAFQKWNLRRDLESMGFDDDLVDVDELFDPSLSLPENRDIIRRHVRPTQRDLEVLLEL